MILVDTSIWIDHLRKHDEWLATMLDAGDVLIHPFVLGEIACGQIRNRTEILESLSDLPTAPVASQSEVFLLIEKRQLTGRGIGFIDMHLIASALLDPVAQLWTRDKKLSMIASELGVGHRMKP